MLKRAIVILILMLILFTVFANQVAYASELDKIINDAEDWVSNGNNDIISEQGLKDFSDTLYNSLLLIGMVIAVIVGTIIGIKFMISSVEEKAKIKEILVVYFVGCIVLVGAFSIWKIIILIMG